MNRQHLLRGELNHAAIVKGELGALQRCQISITARERALKLRQCGYNGAVRWGGVAENPRIMINRLGPVLAGKVDGLDGKAGTDKGKIESHEKRGERWVMNRRIDRNAVLLGDIVFHTKPPRGTTSGRF